ncbi:Hypothetical protein BN69_2528 [Methylocystis sp. SC2]|nr:Hypothetical protein BN69_2528 [Methylocystis sp. SC2]
MAFKLLFVRKTPSAREESLRFRPPTMARILLCAAGDRAHDREGHADVSWSRSPSFLPHFKAVRHFDRAPAG